MNTSGSIFGYVSTVTCGVMEWHTIADKQTDGERQTDRWRDRQKDSWTDTQADRWTDTQTRRQTNTDMHADRQTIGQTDRQTNVQTDKWTDRQTNGQTDRQMDRLQYKSAERHIPPIQRLIFVEFRSTHWWETIVCKTFGLQEWLEISG